MTTTTAELCGHRWPVLTGAVYHVCARVAGHHDDPTLRRSGTCECRCGATTTRKDTR
jgi:hypothetical protein